MVLSYLMNILYTRDTIYGFQTFIFHIPELAMSRVRLSVQSVSHKFKHTQTTPDILESLLYYQYKLTHFKKLYIHNYCSLIHTCVIK